MFDMEAAAAQEQKRAAGLWRLGVWLAVYLVAFGVFAFIASRHCTGLRLMVLLVFTETAALAAFGVFAAAAFDPTTCGVGGCLRRFAGTAAAMVAVSAATLTVAAVAWGAAGLGAALLAQIVVVCFLLLLASVFCLIRRLGSELLTAQLVSLMVAAALLGTVFYIDPAVEAAEDSDTRAVVVRATLASNPLTAVSWSLFRFDLMRARVMYDRVSVIGRYYRTPYPAWWQTAEGYACVFAALFGASVLAGRRRRQRMNHSDKPEGS